MTGSIFYAIEEEDGIEPDHPLLPIQQMVGGVLVDPSLMLAGCSRGIGGASVPRDVLFKALVLRRVYLMRSVRQLVE